MNFTNAAYSCLALAAVLTCVRLWMLRRHAQHPPTVIREPHKYEFPKHVHMLRVGRSSVERLTEGVQLRCCMAGCEEPFYMDGETVAWVRDWLNATHSDSVKVQAIR